MKKSHHADITKFDCTQDEIIKELQDFYSFLIKNQDKHSIVKIKSKAKISKMMSNINTMIQNNNTNFNPYLKELQNILIFIVSPNIDDTDIRNSGINCLFLLISFFNSFEKDYLSPIIESLFSYPPDNDKKQKNSKRIFITTAFARFIKQIKNEDDQEKKKMWLQIIFYCVFPSLKKIKQQEPAILSECSNNFIEAIIKILSKATEKNAMDYFIKEENFFIIFESATLLKNLYNFDDRKLAILFYSRIFPCTFYFIDVDLSAHKFEKKDDMNEILQNRRYSGWGGPNLLASFNSTPRPFFYQIADIICKTTSENTFMVLLEPLLEAICFMLNQIKESSDVATDIIDLYFIIMRLRNFVRLCYKASDNLQLINTSFTCMIMCVAQSNAAYKEYFPFFLSFYLTILFDSKYINVQEVHNFITSIINMANINESYRSNVMMQICVHVVAMISIALSTFLLDIPEDQSKLFLTNTMEMKISMKPLILTLLGRITTSHIYFFLQIIGCDFSEILKQNYIKSSSFPSSCPRMSNKLQKETNNLSNTKSVDGLNSVIDLNQEESVDKWTKEKASEFVLDLIKAVDSSVSFFVSATVADVLLCILKKTNNSNGTFIFEKILPILFVNAFNKKSELVILIRVLRKQIRNAHRFGFFNRAMSYDWFRVIQTYILSNVSKDIKNEIVFGTAHSIIQGCPMSLSLIPLFIYYLNDAINSSNKFSENVSKGEKDNLAFKKNILLICSCVAEIYLISRNNPIFSYSLPSIDSSLKDTILKIFANKKEFASSFEAILLGEGGLKTKCLLLLKSICSAINPKDLKNVEKLILLLLFGQLVDKNNKDEKNNKIIESMFIDNFLKSDRLISLSIEFHHMLSSLLHHYNAAMQKFPDLLPSIVHAISMVFVEQKPITNDQCEFLLRFVTCLAIVTDNNMIMYQCLNIISLPTNSPDKKIILDKAFDIFIYNHNKKIGVVNLSYDDMLLVVDKECIYSLKFNDQNNDKNINTVAIQVSNQYGASNYTLKYINNSLKEKKNVDFNNNQKLKANSKLLREFMLYPSTALFFQILSESNNGIIKGSSKNEKFTAVAKKAFLRDQHVFVDAGIIYIGKNQNNKEEFLLNEWKNVSGAFSTFLSSIGKFYKPSEIPFLFDDKENIYDEMKNDEAVLCWSDVLHKVIYSVSPLAKYGKDDREVMSWNRFKNKKYLIIWSENKKQVDLSAEGFLFDGKLEYAFIIRPYNQNMASLSIYQKRNDFNVFGFFKKSMLLPFDLIGFVISSTLILFYDMNKQLFNSNLIVPIDKAKKNNLNISGDDAVMFKP